MCATNPSWKEKGRKEFPLGGRFEVLPSLGRLQLFWERGHARFVQILYQTKDLFPSEEVKKRTSSTAGYTLAAGEYEYPFQLKVRNIGKAIIPMLQHFACTFVLRVDEFLLTFSAIVALEQ